MNRPFMGMAPHESDRHFDRTRPWWLPNPFSSDNTKRYSFLDSGPHGL